MGCFGGDVQYPGPTPQETALQTSQADALKAQTATLQKGEERVAALEKTQGLLAPLMYESAGIIPTYEGGQITGFTRRPKTEAEQLLEQANTLWAERQIQGLKGEIPVDAAMVQDFDTMEAKLHAQGRQALGPGYEWSTPFQESLKEFTKAKEGAYSSARRGDLTTAADYALKNQAFLDAMAQNAINKSAYATAYPYSASMSGLPTIASGYGSLASGYNYPIQSLAGQRQNEYAGQINQSNQESAAKAQLISGLFQAAGMGVGAYGALK